MITVVVDTNIIISAIVFGGKPRRILTLIQTGRIQAFISPFIVFELKEVFSKKFGFTDTKIQEVESLISDSFMSVFPKVTLEIIKDYTVDNKILEVAVEARVDYLITGDKKHILKLKKINTTAIVSPEEFLLLL